MNKHIIVDSSALISLFSADDSNHKFAAKISKTIFKNHKIVCIPGEVFAETVNTIGKKFSHKQALKFGREILDSKEYQIVDTTEELRTDALTVFKSQAESVSFTDCIVMATADHFSTKEIFGFDKTFSKNGYMAGVA